MTSSTNEPHLECEFNEFGQPIGLSVTAQSVTIPAHTVREGSHVRLEPLRADRHAAQLFANVRGHDALWTYMPQGPFATQDDLAAWIVSVEDSADPQFYAMVDMNSGEAQGVGAFLRIDPNARSIEVGWLTFSPAMQRTAKSTEALFMMFNEAFDLGYRRLEWKCNALNAPSRATAERWGMGFEGIFRQATIVKGRNRDTAWYSLLDSEWPRVRDAARAWLDSGNFVNGQQIQRLDALMSAH